MHLKLVHKLMMPLSVFSFILIVIGIVEFILSSYQGEPVLESIILIIIGLSLIFMSYMVDKLVSYVEKQQEYFNNRIKYLENRIDELRK